MKCSHVETHVHVNLWSNMCTFFCHSFTECGTPELSLWCLPTMTINRIITVMGTTMMWSGSLRFGLVRAMKCWIRWKRIITDILERCKSILDTLLNIAQSLSLIMLCECYRKYNRWFWSCCACGSPQRDAEPEGVTSWPWVLGGGYFSLWCYGYRGPVEDEVRWLVWGWQ